MRAPLELAAKAAEVPDMPVAIFGESGTGKELFARAIHSASGCPKSRFVGLNCAGIPDGLLESELFGHVKGAFTGADSEREGKFGKAREGTLLLDEIGAMPFELQAKLLRVLQERAYEKVGSDKPVAASARIIAATNADLEALVKDGKFREDLFHRVNAYPIALPPLRERKEDIALLADYFIEKFRSHCGKHVPGISEAAMEMLREYSWPGNVRELKNCIERAIIVNNGELVRPEHLMLKPNATIGNARACKSGPGPDADGKISIRLDFDPQDFSLDAVIAATLVRVLESCGNNKAKAAEMLKVSSNIFYRRNVK